MKSLLVAVTLVMGLAPMANAGNPKHIIFCGHGLFPPCDPIEIFVLVSLYG